MQIQNEKKLTNFSMKKRKKIWIYSATALSGVILLGSNSIISHADAKPSSGDIINYAWGNPDNTWGWKLDSGNAPGLDFSGSAQITVTPANGTGAYPVYCIQPGKHLTNGTTASDVQNALNDQSETWSKLSDATKKTIQNVVWSSKTFANGTGSNDWPLSAITQGWVWNLVTGTNGGQAPSQSQWHPDTTAEGGAVSTITWGQLSGWGQKIKDRMATYDQTHKGKSGIDASKINLPSFDKSTQTLIYGQTLTLKNTNNIVGTNKSLVDLTDPATKLKVDGLKFTSTGLNNTVTGDTIKLTAKTPVNQKFVVNYEASAKGTPGEAAHTDDDYDTSGLGAFVITPKNSEQQTTTAYQPVITTTTTKGDDGKPSSMKGSFEVNEIALGQNTLTKTAVGDVQYSQAGAVFEIINKTTGKAIKSTDSVNSTYPISALVGTMTEGSDGNLQFTTDSSGKVGVKNLLVTSKYAWKEVKSPNGNALNGTEIPFEFDTSKDKVDNSTSNIISPDTNIQDKPTGELKLTKTATNDKFNKYISGAQYQFFKDASASSKLTQKEGIDLKNGNSSNLNLLNDKEQKWTNETDANVTLGKTGIADIGFVDISANKNYSVKESKAPLGFALDPKVHTLIFDKDSSLNSQKTAYIAEGQSANKPIGEINVSKSEYRLDINGFKPNKVDSNISYEGAVFEVVDQDGNPLKVKTAVDPKTGEDNVDYTITKGEAYSDNGNLAIKAGKDGKIGVQGLDISKSTKYGVKEIVAPYGYTVNDEIIWTDDYSNEAPSKDGFFTQDVEVKNAVIDFNFGFSKESIAKNQSTSNKVGEDNAYFLNGAVFTLTPQKGTIDDGSYDHDETSQNKEDIQGFVQGGWVQFDHVRVGKYDLVESKVPNGYKAVDPMTVEITSDKYDGGSTEYTFTVKNVKTGKVMYTRTKKIDDYKSYTGPSTNNKNEGFGYDTSVSMGSFNLGILTDNELIPTINSQAFDVSDKDAVKKMISYETDQIAKFNDQIKQLTSQRDEAIKNKDDNKANDLQTQIDFIQNQIDDSQAFIDLIQSNNNTNENVLPHTESIWDEDANSTLNVITTDPSKPESSELTAEYLSNKGKLVSMFADHTLIYENNAIAKVTGEVDSSTNNVKMQIEADDKLVTFDYNLSTGVATNVKTSELPKDDSKDTSKDDSKSTDKDTSKNKIDNKVDQSLPTSSDAQIGDLIWGTGLHSNTKYYYNNVLFNQKTGKAVKASELGKSAIDQINAKPSENANATYLGSISNVESINISKGVATIKYKDGQVYTSSKKQTKEFNEAGTTKFRMSSSNGIVTFVYDMQTGQISDLKTDNKSNIVISKDDIVYVQGSFFTDDKGNYATLAPTTSIDTTKVKDPITWIASVYLNEAPKPTDSLKPTGDYVVYDTRELKSNTSETLTPSVPLIKTKAHTEDGNNVINLTERGEHTKMYDNISYQNTLTKDYIGDNGHAYIWRIAPGKKAEKVGQVDFKIDNQQVIDQIHEVATEVDTSKDVPGTIYTWGESITDKDTGDTIVTFNDDHKDQDETLTFETSPGRGGITPTQSAVDTGGKSDKGIMLAIASTLSAAIIGIGGFFGFKKFKKN